MGGGGGRYSGVIERLFLDIDVGIQRSAVREIARITPLQISLLFIGPGLGTN